MLLRNSSAVGLLLLLVAIAMPARAEIVGEGVLAVRCTEGTDLQVPKKMQFTQSMMMGDFEGYGRVLLVLDAEYAEASSVNKGSVIAAVLLIKADGTEVSLGKLKAKMRGGQAEKNKLVNAEIEQGDALHWRVKTRGMAALRAEDEDCMEFSFIVAVGDEVLE